MKNLSGITLFHDTVFFKTAIWYFLENIAGIHKKLLESRSVKKKAFQRGIHIMVI